MINGLNAEMLRSDHVLSDWNSINWKKTERRVKRLRTGIYQATKKEDMKEVRYLQKLLLNSFAAKVLAIKRITQINDGRKTPGIDGKVIDNHEDRVKIANEKIDFKSYKPYP